MNRRWYEQPTAIAELWALRWAAVALLALWLVIAAAAVAWGGAVAHSMMQPAERPTVLVVERTYDGPVERLAGDVLRWQYRGSVMYVEIGDLDADGIFRSGFDAPARFPPLACDGRCE